MVERFYEFAGVVWRVCTPKDMLYRESGVLAPFMVSSDNEPNHTLEFEAVDRVDLPEGDRLFSESNKQFYSDGNAWIRYQGSTRASLDTAYMRIRRERTLSQVQIKNTQLSDGLTTKMVLNALEAEHHIVSHGGFLLHSSFVRWGDGAILFTAPSQTGKSTQADLWSRLRGAEQINGDRAAVMVDRNGAQAWGIPFCGSSGISKNVNVPLRAIVYLSQAPETNISRLTGLRAFSRVWEGCCVNSWDRGDLEQCTDAVMNVIASVPVFHLACTPDETAVIALERAMEEKR